MTIETLEIVSPGLLTTVQDRGRDGYQKFGVPVSGAMDSFALRVANILVGNRQRSAGLEMTALGPEVRFLDDTLIAVTGADLSPVLDGEALPTWRSIKVSKGSVLSFQGVRDGMRSYLAIAGGIDVPVVLESRSTYLKGVMGGMEGRALKAGDVLHAAALDPSVKLVEQGLPENLVAPSYGHEHEIRVILGPQHKSFTADGIATLLGSRYSVSIQSDRTGYRLDGPPIEHVSGPDVVSDGTPLGAVQVPGDGLPIILLADRGPTGGYAKIATVISADIGVLAQAMAGDAVVFKAVALQEAYSILREQEAVVRAIKRASTVGSSGRVCIVMPGQEIEVVNQAGDAIAVPASRDEPISSRRHHVSATAEGRTYEFDVEVQELE